MRLLTHNLLACNIKGVTKGFPLGIEATKLETKDSEVNAEFLRHILPKLEWKAFYDAAHSSLFQKFQYIETDGLRWRYVEQTIQHIDFDVLNTTGAGWHGSNLVILGLDDLPEQVEPAMLEDDDFLQKFHHALLEVHLEEGALICPETGRRFPVTKGVPNMLLNEDEV